MAVYAASLTSPLDLDDIESILNGALPVKVTTFTNATTANTTAATYSTPDTNNVTVAADECLLLFQKVYTSHSSGATAVITSLDVDGTDYVEIPMTDALTSAVGTTMTHTAIWALTGLTAGSRAINTKFKNETATGTAYYWGSSIVALQFKYRT